MRFQFEKDLPVKCHRGRAAHETHTSLTWWHAKTVRCTPVCGSKILETLQMQISGVDCTYYRNPWWNTTQQSMNKGYLMHWHRKTTTHIVKWEKHSAEHERDIKIGLHLHKIFLEGYFQKATNVTGTTGMSGKLHWIPFYICWNSETMWIHYLFKRYIYTSLKIKMLKKVSTSL